jgi:hypothetical protein
MLHPAMLLAVAVLALNDHWLKGRFGTGPTAGMVTGKASDVAGLAFFPALVVSVIEVARWARRRGRGGWASGRRELAAAMAVTAAGFAAVQSIPPAAVGYEAVLVVLRWWPACVAAALGGQPWPPIPEVDHVMDASDILCVPAVWASDWTARRTGWHRTMCAMATTGGRASGT